MAAVPPPLIYSRPTLSDPNASSFRCDRRLPTWSLHAALFRCDRRLVQVLGEAIPPPAAYSTCPSIPIRVILASSSRERFEPFASHLYPRRGAGEQLDSILGGLRGEKPHIAGVKMDYQLPDNLAFTGPHVAASRGGAEVCRLGACEVYLITCSEQQPDSTLSPSEYLRSASSPSEDHGSPWKRSEDDGSISNAGGPPAAPPPLGLAPFYGVHSKVLLVRPLST